MSFTFDVVNGYVIQRGDKLTGVHYDFFSDAVKDAQDGDHIHMVSGRGDSKVHERLIKCSHGGCGGTISPFPRASCEECRSY